MRCASIRSCVVFKAIVQGQSPGLRGQAKADHVVTRDATNRTLFLHKKLLYLNTHIAAVWRNFALLCYFTFSSGPTNVRDRFIR